MLIQTQQLEKIVETSEGPLQILQPIDLAINAGETVAIVGASGSGKSTLLSLLAGLDIATHGDVLIENEKLSDLDEEQRAKLRADKVGFIFQSFLLVPSLSALENVMLPAELAGHKGAEKEARELLEKVGLADRWHHYPNQLSGGEQQRVAIARAFVGQPKILFADEPTGNLDSKTGDKVEQLLFDLNKDYGTTLVMVTHDTTLAKRCQRILNMEAGQLAEASRDVA
ncbi:MULTISPECIES: ABC transporter ATP-binding protein [Idiomarina]|jgi:putative ABC transport system ATP-binding protein|uniref:ABC-type transport system, ATPase component n=1 Tax=Idiomarina baltica OS145 TaxID=314276 RepID=A0ABM9WL75_9GAMM|nr:MULTISPECIES: ABC transporter ATP-binding protein [Idiomarina]MBL75270.1 ABC transporter ATP-binding protein [Idiomarinaceae bacterium]MEC7643252.1 ABC transporter ATP-binding protein [Pseudomonadota bacterium]EAQ31652.1 ABC-type transport system, ATPase component [Idiomarina baltica OS145]KXS35433.1 MAG: putative ABC transport system ATP-binding protein [Idiomarina sp. T82-3]MBR37483.1 ABC transporter ATP-binding protein [Idiomarina sp.]|tara:strand:+ start:737 stop:1417 length:681 start_codon:yes stop_codon:yes gene_type:complete